MILKFRSSVTGGWVYEDGVCQVKTGHCRFVECQPGGAASETRLDMVEDKTVQAMYSGSEVEGPLDFDWVVDLPTLDKLSGFKWVQCRYGKAAGWHTPERTFVFENGSPVFLLNDDGKTIERM